MGAPGSFYWTGSFVYNMTTNKYKAFLDRHNQVKIWKLFRYCKNRQTGIISTLQTLVTMNKGNYILKRSKWPVVTKKPFQKLPL